PVLLALMCAGAETSTLQRFIGDLDDADRVNAALDALVAAKSDAVPLLAAEAKQGRSLGSRGWAIVGLARIGGPEAQTQLKQVYDEATNPPLVRSWALAARVDSAGSFEQINEVANEVGAHPEIVRPIAMRASQLPTPDARQKRILI